MVRKKAVVHITADKKVLISNLVEIVENFLPLSASSDNATTFKTIFKESNIDNYLQGSNIKKKSLQIGFEKLFRYHERLPRTIIRKIVDAAINYRKHKRNPLNKDELEKLIICLFKLGFDMKSELNKINLNFELPEIVIPPKNISKFFNSYPTHFKMMDDVKILFQNGHYNEAVRKSLEKFEGYVKEITSLDAYGKDLMAKAFKDGEYINIDNIKSENRDDFILGYKMLAMGAMSGIRNIFSHGDEVARSPEECFEMLILINWLYRYVKS